MRNLWKWLKGLFVHDTSVKPYKPAEPYKPEPIPPVIVVGHDFFTVEQLFQIMRYTSYSKTDGAVHLGCEKYHAQLNKMFKQYDINTYYRICHALAQIGKESGHLRHVKEIGSWKYKFTKSYWPKWKGRGLIQLTHKYNYARYQKNLAARGYPQNILKNPDIVAELPFSVDVVGFYWARHDLNEMCDLGDAGIRPLTKRINGAYGGIIDRAAIYHRAKEVLK